MIVAQVILDRDLITRITISGGVEVGPFPKGVGIERLRWDGEKLIDIADLTEMWIDTDGQIHAIEVPSSQLMQMTWADRRHLVKTPVGWRLKDLDDWKAEKLMEINTAYDAAISSLPLDPPKERETYHAQYMEAIYWTRDNTFPTPMIDGLLFARQVPGEDKAALVEKIITAATLFGMYGGPMTGKRQRLEKATRAANTKAELDSIQW
jgi:hypothetical protein